jgi:hypothetical protein
MRKLFVVILLFSGCSVIAQSGGKFPIKKSDTKLISSDSILNALKAQSDSTAKALKERTDSASPYITPRNQTNLKYYFDIQQKNEARQKRNSMIRIGIGILLAVVLVIGLRRRSRQAKKIS